MFCHNFPHLIPTRDFAGYCMKQPKQARQEIIHYPRKAKCFSGQGTKRSYFPLWSTAATGRLKFCDWHSPCRAKADGSWQPCVLLVKLSWEVGLLSCLRLHPAVHFHYQLTHIFKFQCLCFQSYGLVSRSVHKNDIIWHESCPYTNLKIFYSRTA